MHRWLPALALLVLALSAAPPLLAQPAEAGGDAYLQYAERALALAEAAAYREAEQMVEQGLAAARAQIERERPLYETAEDAAWALEEMSARLYDVLGQVYHREGRLDAAEAALQQAQQLSPGDAAILYHLGRLREARQDVEQAEAFYLRGLAAATPGRNPNEAALRTLYRDRYGPEQGDERYHGAEREADRRRRRARVLGDRIDAPASLLPFTLRRLDGTSFSSDALSGKVVVLHVWGLWCGWCVRELPDLQQFYTQIEDDPEVVLLTINNDAEPDSVRAVMARQRYRFPVLLDDGYAAQRGIHAFPTTYFIDRRGQVAFVQEGATEHLVEAFGWRIEALRAAAAE